MPCQARVFMVSFLVAVIFKKIILFAYLKAFYASCEKHLEMVSNCGISFLHSLEIATSTSVSF